MRLDIERAEHRGDHRQRRGAEWPLDDRQRAASTLLLMVEARAGGDAKLVGYRQFALCESRDQVRFLRIVAVVARITERAERRAEREEGRVEPREVLHVELRMLVIDAADIVERFAAG